MEKRLFGFTSANSTDSLGVEMDGLCRGRRRGCPLRDPSLEWSLGSILT